MKLSIRRPVPMLRGTAALALTLVLPALGLSAVTAAEASPSAPQAQRAAAPPYPTLVGVRAVHRGAFDRVVFKFRGSLPMVRTRYVDELIADGSGKRVRIAGRAILQVTFEPARAHTAQGAATAAPRRRAFALPNVMTAVRSGDFEGQVNYGLGLARKSPVKVTSVPAKRRVIVQVRAGFPTVKRQVFFLDRDNFQTGEEPYFVPVRRRVLATEPATAVMDRLFAGPTPAEFRRGLRLIRSGATTFTDLEITDGIARVRLLGRCNSRGSTATIANEIQPTLRQFDTVDWVKIYDPTGQTGTPGGPSDSIPTCLEP